MPTGQRAIARRILTALVRPADTVHHIPAVRQQKSVAALRQLAGTAAPAGGEPSEHGVDEALAVAGLDGKAQLWDVASRRRRAILIGHAKTVWTVTFSGDGRTLATASEDGTVRLWDVATGRRRATLRADALDISGHTADVNVTDFSRDGRILVTSGSDGRPGCWMWPPESRAAPCPAPVPT